MKSCYSKATQHFIIKKGNAVDACDEYGETLLHWFAGIKWSPLIYADYLKLVALGWSLEKKDVCGNTPIDEAIDCHNWVALDIFIQAKLSHHCIVHAIGELLAQYWHIGSAIHDQFIFSLIKKAGKLSKRDCEYLLIRACNGAAWPYLIPLSITADYPLSNLKRDDFPWQIEDNNRLFLQIMLKIGNHIGCPEKGMDIFLFDSQGLQMNLCAIEDKNSRSRFPFIAKRRQCMTRRLKRQIKKGKFKVKFLSSLISMYGLKEDEICSAQMPNRQRRG